MSAAHQQQKSSSLGDLAGTTAFAVGLISAWLYTTGWTYAYHYFDRFGIPLLMVNIPKENYFVYGGVVLRQFAVWGLLIVGAGVLLFVIWRRVSPLLGRWALPLGVLVVLALFWLGHVAGVAAAHEQYRVQRESDYSAYPRVQLWSKENAETPADFPPVSDALASSCYRLLLHNQERPFLTRPFKEAGAADLPVLILPWDQIAQVRVLPVSCRNTPAANSRERSAQQCTAGGATGRWQCWRC